MKTNVKINPKTGKVIYSLGFYVSDNFIGRRCRESATFSWCVVILGILIMLFIAKDYLF